MNRRDQYFARHTPAQPPPEPQVQVLAGPEEPPKPFFKEVPMPEYDRSAAKKEWWKQKKAAQK